MFFVDRVQEMSVLQTAYEKPESSLFVLVFYIRTNAYKVYY